MVEVTDQRDKPLLLLPRQRALRSRLPHRQVRVALQDAKGRILLVRKTPPDGASDLWSLPGGLVGAGESREGAALRLLERDLGVKDLLLPPWTAVPPLPGIAFSLALFRAPLASAPMVCSKRVFESMLLDDTELTGIAAHFSGLLAPDLEQMAKAGYVFGRTSSMRKSS